MALPSTSPSPQKFLPFLELLFLFLSLPHLVASLPTNQTERLLLEGAVGATRPSCADIEHYPNWFQPSKKFDNGDCTKAIGSFYNEYVKNHEGARYEFYNNQFMPIHGIPTQKLPLKFSSGTCTVAIAMRNQFNWGELPHETPFRSAPSDISSFQKLYQGVLEIDTECVAKTGDPGWYQSGDLNSIAVFIWQGASEINQRITLSGGGLEELNSTVTAADTS